MLVNDTKAYEPCALKLITSTVHSMEGKFTCVKGPAAALTMRIHGEDNDVDLMHLLDYLNNKEQSGIVRKRTNQKNNVDFATLKSNDIMYYLNDKRITTRNALTIIETHVEKAITNYLEHKERLV